MSKNWIYLVAILIVVGGFLLWQNSNTPKENIRVDDNIACDTNFSSSRSKQRIMRESKREIIVTDGIKHSIPLNEILSGGPPKNGIPSIDNPKFISTNEADKDLSDDSIGLGVKLNGETKFYPYQILVWHEIVNDKIGDDPILVTYCPLCATGVVYDRRVRGEEQEFGVSGKLWQSNLLMYNRAEREEDESLWSQVLGGAVLGKNTGEKLSILSSDTVKYGNWKKCNPETKILSKDTGSLRRYGQDPYEDYYTSDIVSFGVRFNDDRLHPKAFVLGIEVNDKFKVYDKEAIKEGPSTDNFAGEEIRIEKSNIGEVRMFIGDKELPYIGGFWFSWLAVHPSTELFK